MHNITSKFDKNFTSPYDELAHFDYWQKIYREHRLPSVFEKVSPENLGNWQCSGVQSEASRLECKKLSLQHIDIENTATNYAPTFYLLTAFVSAAIEPLFTPENDFHLAKMSCLIWGYTTLLLVWWLTRVLLIPQPIAALIIFAIAQNPAFIFGSITFNQEIFVLGSCVLTLAIYLKWLRKMQGHLKFVLLAALLSAFCLSIKPTALLIVVVISVGEVMVASRSFRVKLFRAISYGFSTLGIYGSASFLINKFRGVNPSDGRMAEYVSRETSGRSFFQWVEILWAHFERSTASYGWRHLSDYDLPWLFLYFHKFFIITFFVAIVFILITVRSKVAWPVSMSIFIGNMLAFVALPVVLALYVNLTGLPFFFQPRYYTAYTCLAVVTASAFLLDVVRIMWGEFEAWRIQTGVLAP